MLPDPLVEARNDFLGEIMALRERVICAHGGVLDDNSEYQGPHVAAVNDLTGQFLYFLDGGEINNGGYTVLPNRMINNGLAGTLPNIAGELGPTYDSFFEDINS
jgi:hypothetical protein